MKDNIKVDLRETGWGGMNLIHLSQDRNYCEYGKEHWGSIKYWKIPE
jgi:hypothetical protein